jgi:hypothetical protein
MVEDAGSLILLYVYPERVRSAYVEDGNCLILLKSMKIYKKKLMVNI